MVFGGTGVTHQEPVLSRRETVRGRDREVGERKRHVRLQFAADRAPTLDCDQRSQHPEAVVHALVVCDDPTNQQVTTRAQYQGDGDRAGDRIGSLDAANGNQPRGNGSGRSQAVGDRVERNVGVHPDYLRVMEARSVVPEGEPNWAGRYRIRSVEMKVAACDQDLGKPCGVGLRPWATGKSQERADGCEQRVQ
jgi:hypothetical protein